LIKLDTTVVLTLARIQLRPLHPSDFEELYSVAADPQLWEQHPQRDRYKRDVFETFFALAMEQGTAYVVVDTAIDKVIGSSRYYEPAADGAYIYIGYTFLSRERWGKGANQIIKRLMLDHAFTVYPEVRFQVGINNRRSRIAVERLGAQLIGTVEVNDPGAAVSPHVEYAISREEWSERKR